MTTTADFVTAQARRFEHFPAVQAMVAQSAGSFMALVVSDDEVAVDVLGVEVALASSKDGIALIGFNFDGEEVYVPFGEDGLPSVMPPSEPTGVMGYGIGSDHELFPRDFRFVTMADGIAFCLDGRTVFTAACMYESALADGVDFGQVGLNIWEGTYTPERSVPPALGQFHSDASAGATLNHLSLSSDGMALRASVWSSSTGYFSKVTLTYPLNELEAAARRLHRNGEL